MKQKNEILLYQANDLTTKLEVIIQDETIWLTQMQIVSLFDSSKANISEHIKHIFASEELQEEATVRKIRTVRKEGTRMVERDLLHYNLDMIISIGYRVNSIIGTQFRIWANKVIKEYLLKGYSINRRMDRIEDSVETIKTRLDRIDLQIESESLSTQGIFFDGQVFDAYAFVSDLIKSAKDTLTLVDNYIDESVLLLFAKRQNDVDVTIYTKNNTKSLKQDLQKYNTQYPQISIKSFSKAHDRFLIIDRKVVYHFGASLKDLGKKWFAFSKMKLQANDIIVRLEAEGVNE